MKKRLIIIGGHGSGEIAASVFSEVNIVTNEWIIEGFLTDILNPGERLGRFPVLGPTSSLLDWVNKGYHIHYTLHFNSKQKKQRVELFRSLSIPLEVNASAVHPRAYLDPSTKVGYGSLFCAHSATSFGAQVGNFVHLYTNSFVGHDSIIGDFATITAHSVVGGRIRVQEGAHIGLNSCIREDITIGAYSIIAMGAVVIKNVDDFQVVGGNPAKFISSLNKDT